MPVHHYMRSLQLSKSLRDAEVNFDVDELSRGFMELNVSNFQQVAHHRIGILLNSKVVWNVYQLAMAYASTANGFIAHEIPEAIGDSVTVTTNKGEVVTGTVMAYHEEQDCTVIKTDDSRMFAGIGILNDILEPK